MQRFNRACLGIALAWLGVTIPLGLVFRWTIPDFSQFYLGGVVARTGMWNSLYPVPRPDSPDNPGLAANSTAKPGWEQLAAEHGRVDHTRFILPPPSALLFVPLSFTTCRTAYWIWMLLQIGCIGAVAVLAGRGYRLLSGQESRWEGVLALLVAMSPLAARAIRVANVTPMLAMCIGVAVFALLSRHHSIRGAAAIVVGAMLKYATLVFLPLIVLARRWRMLAWTAALGSAAMLVTLLLAGPAPFREYMTNIAPTLNRPSDFDGNQSLAGFLSRWSGRPLPRHSLLLLKAIRLGSTIVVAWLLFRLRPIDLRKPSLVFPAACMLLTWLMIISPNTWEHWPILLAPFWGWLLWEARQPGLQRAWAIAAWSLMYVPAGIWRIEGFVIFSGRIREPFNSTQLYGMMMTFALAAWRLRQAAAEDLSASEPQASSLASPSGMQQGPIA